MAFSNETRNELARIIPAKECCQLAELGALVRADGVIQLNSGGRLALNLVTENPAVARKTFFLFRKLFEIQPEVMVRKNSRLHKKNTYMVRISLAEETKRILLKLGMMDKQNHFYYGIKGFLIKKSCCAQSYLRGAFLGGGSVNNPAGKDYHLEFLTDSQEYAQQLISLLTRYNLRAGVSERKDKVVIYLKEADQIIEALNVMGAHNALLNFENIRVLKGMKNKVNRLVNCETANLEKTVDAAMRQVDNIQLIEKNFGLNKLPKGLRDLAELRLDYPEANLKELGEMLIPKVGKSGVNHRMRKIDQIAEQIRMRKIEEIK